MLFRSEGVFHFSQLDVLLPYRFGIGLCPVGAQDVTASALKRPLITVFTLFDIYGKTPLFP